jgi:hypothetical protein
MTITEWTERAEYSELYSISYSTDFCKETSVNLGKSVSTKSCFNVSFCSLPYQNFLSFSPHVVTTWKTSMRGILSIH